METVAVYHSIFSHNSEFSMNLVIWWGVRMLFNFLFCCRKELKDREQHEREGKTRQKIYSNRLEPDVAMEIKGCEDQELILKRGRKKKREKKNKKR